MRNAVLALATLLALALIGGPALAAVNSVTPSTNDANRTKSWSHFDTGDIRIGEVDVTLDQPRGFAACFEYRSDGDTTQILDENNGVNYNPAVTDGLYPYTCLRGASAMLTLTATDYVEIRMVFGAETDERFDWTRVDVLPDAQTKEDCKDGGWADFGFSNQGQCIRFVNTGKDSR